MITVRPGTYRGVEGYYVSGKLPDKSWPTRIFVENKRAAERIAIKVRAGARVTPEDFTIFDGVPE